MSRRSRTLSPEQIAANHAQADHVARLLEVLDNPSPGGPTRPVRRPAYRPGPLPSTAAPAKILPAPQPWPSTPLRAAAAAKPAPISALRAKYMSDVANVLATVEAACESEIERLFLVALLATNASFEEETPEDLLATVGAPVRHFPSSPVEMHLTPPEPDDAPGFAMFVRLYAPWAGGVHIVPQHNLTARGRACRLDFAVLPNDPAACQPIAVELDGHDFHERTKEQAASDRSRDRSLHMAGWEVLRFTGSELWKDPAKCVRDLRVAVTWSALRRGAAAASPSPKRATR